MSKEEIHSAFNRAREMILGCDMMYLERNAKCGSYACCVNCRELMGDETFDKLVEDSKRKGI